MGDVFAFVLLSGIFKEYINRIVSEGKRYILVEWREQENGGGDSWKKNS